MEERYAAHEAVEFGVCEACQTRACAAARIAREGGRRHRARTGAAAASATRIAQRVAQERLADVRGGALGGRGA